MRQPVIYIILMLLVAVTSCSRRPGYVIPEQKMMDVLYDIQLSQAIYKSGSQFNANDDKDALVEGVLRKHNVLQADLDSSLLWYSDNIQYYVTITDSVTARLKARSERLVAQNNERSSKKRDWSSLIVPPLFYLGESTPTMSFFLDSLKLKTIALDKFKLSFDVYGLSKNHDIEAAVFYNYKDTLIKEIVSINKNTRYTFSKPQLADSLLRAISGYVHLHSGKAKGLFSDVILYNVNYTDSIQTDSLGVKSQSHTSLSEEQNISRVKDSDNKERALPVLEKRERLEPDTAIKVKRKDNLPVLSNDDVNNSPTLRHHRKNRSREIERK